MEAANRNTLLCRIFDTLEQDYLNFEEVVAEFILDFVTVNGKIVDYIGCFRFENKLRMKECCPDPDQECDRP